MPDMSFDFWPWLRERLFPRGTNLIQWAAYIIVISMLITYVLQRPAVSPFAFNSSVFALTVILVFNILWDDVRARFRNELTGEWVLLLANSALVFYTILVGGFFNGVYILFILIAHANAIVPPRPALLFSAFLFVAYMGWVIITDVTHGQWTSVLFGLFMGIAFTITLSQVLRLYAEQSEKMNRLNADLQCANAGLLAARQKEKELAIAEERVRVARDLHDGLGHHLTALSIQLQAAEKLVTANPPLAAEAVHNARGEVQAALKEVRQSVAALRETPVDIRHLPQAIAALVEDTAARAGLRGSFAQQGPAADLTPAAAMTLFRTAQEGLTNIQKHAVGAGEIQARLAYSAQEVSLSLENDGQVVADPSCAGFGLAGLRERANLLGGRLDCGPRPRGGFILAIHLPFESAPTDLASTDAPSTDGPSPDGPSPDGPSPDGPSPDGPHPDAPSPDGPPPSAAPGDVP